MSISMLRPQNYFLLRAEPGVPLRSSRHKPFLPHYERVRTLDQWAGQGFPLSVDKNNSVVQKKDRSLYRWVRLWSIGDAEKEAIETGKRFIDHFYPLLVFAQAGVDFEEFVSHPAHYRHFCNGCLALEKSKHAIALGHFQAALQAEPNEVRYAEKLYRLRIDQGDISAVTDELEYFKNEIDTVVHCGRTDAWLKLLLDNGYFENAAKVIQRVSILLEKSIAGELPTSRYTSQSVDFLEAKRNQFRKKIAKLEGSKRSAPLVIAIQQIGGLPIQTQSSNL